MAEAQLDLDISPALASIEELGGILDDILASFGTDLSDAIATAVSNADTLGTTLDDVATTFGSSIVDALDSGVSAADDIGAALGDAASGFSSSLGDVGGKAGESAGGLSGAFNTLATSSEGVASAMDLQEISQKALEGGTAGLTGNMTGLIGSIAPQAAIFAGVTAAVAGLVNMGANAEQAISQMNRVFGDQAPTVLNGKIKDLGFSLSELDTKAGVSDTKMREVLSTFGQTAIGAGATSKEAANVTQQMGSLANVLTVLKPSLGTADQNFQMITRGLGGSVRILQRYGVTIDQAEQKQLALTIAQEHGRATASLYDKQVAGLQLTMEALNKSAEQQGTTLKAQLDKGLDTPIVKLRAMKEAISTELENIAIPLVDAGTKIAAALTPVATQIVAIFGEIAKDVTDGLLPVASVLADTLGPALKVVGDALKEAGPYIGPFVVGLLALKGVDVVVGIVTSLAKAIEALNLAEAASGAGGLLSKFLPNSSEVLKGADALLKTGTATQVLDDSAVALSSTIGSKLLPTITESGASVGVFGESALGASSILGTAIPTVAEFGVETGGIGAASLLAAGGLTTLASAAAAVVLPGVAAFALVDALGLLDQKQTAAEKSGIAWADAEAKGVESSHNLVDAYKVLDERHTSLGVGLQNLKDAQAASIGAQMRATAGAVEAGQEAQKQGLTIDGLNAQYVESGKQLDALKPKYDAYIKSQKDAAPAAKEAVAQANAWGLTVPKSYSVAETSAKGFTKALNDSMVAFHEVGVQAELNAHLTADQMDNIAKHAESMDSATNKAIGSFTDVVSHFAGQWAVSGDQINQFLFTSLGQVNQWASDLKAASAAGIDGGIIDQLRAAGPQSEAVLRGLLNDVANGGLDAINSAQKSIQAIEADLNQSLDQNAIVAQIKILETAQVAQAAFAALNDDGGAQLLQLAQKGDEATKKAADAMIYNLIGSGKVPLAIAGIQEQLNSIHGKDVDINVRYNVLETVVASSSAAATGAALAGVTGVPPSTSTGNAALDAFLGSLPKTAVGGIFDKPEARTIAEAGPEAVIPLNDPGRAWDLIRQSGLLNSMPMSSGLMDSLDANTSAVSAAISGGIGASVGPSEDRSVTIQNLIVNAPRPDPMAIAYETARELAAENYRSGR